MSTTSGQTADWSVSASINVALQVSPAASRNALMPGLFTDAMDYPAVASTRSKILSIFSFRVTAVKGLTM